MSMTSGDSAECIVIEQAVHMTGIVHVRLVLVVDLNLLMHFTCTVRSHLPTSMPCTWTGTWYICTSTISLHVLPFHSCSCCML